ncbi:C1q-like domain-containing protein [Aulosira sp. FACHB-615]|uniref:C1q-like domain-containing protein n=1 Tax=Aulosira sp. FACHB-615 TaxID=2692777 RepID=UPI0016825EF7|nr:hypothetical protein [Aulosira sp. FACHB-615]MBD2489008.1 hypothetical protein [Aulosira sp. FACHB-615]
MGNDSDQDVYHYQASDRLMKVLVLNAGGIAESDLTGVEAIAIAFTPTDSILADNVQAAIVELDDKAVHRAGNETISGIKTFTNGLISGGNISIPDSAWDAGMLELGGYYFWVDGDGFLRIKFGTPASINDGLIVGATGTVAADDVSFTPSGSIASTKVQAAIEEVNSEAQSAITTLDNATLHKTGDESASGTKTLTGSLALPNVAWNSQIFSIAGYRFWINSGKLYFKNGSTPASATDGSIIGPVVASDVAFTPTGNIAANTVQGAIAEVDSETLHTTGNESAAGVKIFTDATEATNPTTGGLQTRGGFASAKNVYIGGNLTVAGGNTGLKLNTPVLIVRRNSSLNVSANTSTKVIYDAVISDTANNYNASTGNYSVGVNDGGLYFAEVSINYSGENNNRNLITLFYNGTNVRIADFRGNSIVGYTSGCKLILVNSGTTVYVEVYQENSANSAKAVTTGISTQLSLFKLSTT